MHKLKGWLTAGLALGCFAAFVVLLVRGPSSGLYLSQTPLLVALIFAGVILSWITGAIFSRARRIQDGEAPPEVDYSHTYRLTGLFAILVVAGAAGRQMLIPDGFGKFGHYRAEAITKSRVLPILHLEEDSCKKCHPKNYSMHAKGMHKPVQCEVCHGPGDRHAAQGDKRYIVRKMLDCLVCHQKLAARPETFPQVDVATHYLNKGVAQGAACWTCHNPHQPLFIDQAASTARVHHPVSHQCRDCHAHMPSGTVKPQKHPVVFDCNYCHPDKARAVAERPHRHLGCRSCHKFSRTAKYYGYIIRFMVKNRDRRFCLMCHEKTKARTGSKPPSIAWKAHLMQMSGNLEGSCVDCHQDKIHPVNKRRRHVGSPPMAAPEVNSPSPTLMDPTPPSPMGSMASPPPPVMAGRTAAGARPRVPPRARPRKRPPRMPSSHRGSAEHKTCNRACHSGLLPATHRGRTGKSCRACHR